MSCSELKDDSSKPKIEYQLCPYFEAPFFNFDQLEIWKVVEILSFLNPFLINEIQLLIKLETQNISNPRKSKSGWKMKTPNWGRLIIVP